MLATIAIIMKTLDLKHVRMALTLSVSSCPTLYVFSDSLFHWCWSSSLYPWWPWAIFGALLMKFYLMSLDKNLASVEFCSRSNLWLKCIILCGFKILSPQQCCVTGSTKVIIIILHMRKIRFWEAVILQVANRTAWPTYFLSYNQFIEKICKETSL